MQSTTQNLTLKSTADATKTMRNSGIELLKVFGIFLIVVSHVLQTINLNVDIYYQGSILSLSLVTTDMQHLVLSILQYSGSIGNTIFFISSAWFLLDSEKFSGKKWISMLLEVWSISAIILVITALLRPELIDKKSLIQSLLPTTLSNNWYITCYLLFYPIHTALNRIIRSMSQSELLRSTSALLILYVGFNFVKGGLFFYSNLVLWIAIYFAVAYIKFYLKNFAENKKANLILFLSGIICNVGLILLTNFLGLKIEFLSDKLLRWCTNGNPFIIISVIALFNLARTAQFKSSFINRLSKLSLLIYIIHDNIIIRKYFRPYIIERVLENCGSDSVLLWVLLLSIGIFTVSAVLSFLYDISLKKLVNKCSLALYHLCQKIWGRFENATMRLH